MAVRYKDDVAIVTDFRRRTQHRAASVYGYRAQMRKLEPRLTKILIDGLTYRDLMSAYNELRESAEWALAYLETRDTNEETREAIIERLRIALRQRSTDGE